MSSRNWAEAYTRNTILPPPNNQPHYCFYDDCLHHVMSVEQNIFLSLSSFLALILTGSTSFLPLGIILFYTDWLICPMGDLFSLMSQELRIHLHYPIFLSQSWDTSQGSGDDFYSKDIWATFQPHHTQVRRRVLSTRCLPHDIIVWCCFTVDSPLFCCSLNMTHSQKWNICIHCVQSLVLPYYHSTLEGGDQSGPVLLNTVPLSWSSAGPLFFPICRMERWEKSKLARAYNCQ